MVSREAWAGSEEELWYPKKNYGWFPKIRVQGLGFAKIRGPILRVLTIRIIVFGVL